MRGIDVDDGIDSCAQCDREFIPAEGRNIYCSIECRWRKNLVTNRDARRTVVDAIKLMSGCADCGYDEYPFVLDFDHLPQHEKLFSIGSAIYKQPMSNILNEITKCEVVCANCHRVRTTKRNQYGRKG